MPSTIAPTLVAQDLNSTKDQKVLTPEQAKKVAEREKKAAAKAEKRRLKAQEKEHRAEAKERQAEEKARKAEERRVEKELHRTRFTKPEEAKRLEEEKELFAKEFETVPGEQKNHVKISTGESDRLGGFHMA